MAPLWEGFDEWAYFAVIDHMRSSGERIVDRDLFVSNAIHESLALAPLPRGMTRIPPSGVDHEGYWLLSESDRSSRQDQMNRLSGSAAESTRSDLMPAYEASQAPLYYWVLSTMLRPFGHASLLTRVWLARIFTLLVGSLIVPVSYLLFREFWQDPLIAAKATALLAALPALLLDLFRVSNEGLNCLFFTCLMLLFVKIFRQPAARK